MLIPFPFAFLAGAFLFDLAGRITRNQDLSQTGRHLTVAGIGAGLLAAVPGIVDYFESVPPRSSAKDRATKHAISNVTGLALFAASLFSRRGKGRATAGTLTAQAAGVGMLGVGGWMGGTLVYRNQIGVDHRYADAGKWREDSTEDLQVNQMALIHADGERVVVARTEEGYRAFDDRCTHRGGPLSDGVLICGTVQCPWHGSQFDVTTGAVKCGPAERNIATYPLLDSGHGVSVRLRLEAGSSRRDADHSLRGAE